MTFREEWPPALAGLRWAWAFYRRHALLVIGLSLIPSAQRLVVVNWEGVLPSDLATASEVLVMAVRVLLVVLIWRLAVPRGQARSANVGPFVAAHWPRLVLHGLLLVLATVIFGNGLEALGDLLPESAGQTYLAVLLFVKNPTIIAFTLVWVVGMVREMFLCRPGVPAQAVA